MGLIFGKIKVETPKYELIKATNVYEIRKYPACVVAKITYHPSEMKNNDKDGGFTILVNYIGAFGKPQNAKPEKISMTVPVITNNNTTSTAEPIAMTVPVVTSTGGREETAVTMKFILPSKYKKAEEVPKPLDERVEVREEGEWMCGVVKFSGVASDGIVKEKVEVLRKRLESDGYKVIGGYLLARYNPTWSIPMFRTNEVMLPIEE